MNQMKYNLLSVVIPCFNEEEVIKETANKLLSISNSFHHIKTELIFVDDGSSDSTLSILEELHASDNRIKIISFSRNFGHQIAVTAGIDAACGDCVVLIDADLQDPPEIIKEMISLWRGGYDVVYATRRKRGGESVFKIYTAGIFYRILNKLSSTKIPLDTGDFRLMDRRVVNALCKMPEKDRFIRGMVSWVGFKQISIQYDRDERFAGVTKYSLLKMVSFALDGILSFSSAPLRVAIMMGIASSLIALIGIFYALIARVFSNNWVEGWTALIISILFLGGVQLICIGIVGEYIGRIYSEVKSRPLYLIYKKVGFDDQSVPK